MSNRNIKIILSLFLLLSGVVLVGYENLLIAVGMFLFVWGNNVQNKI